MTSYTSEELDSDWEFKILRSIRGDFRRPDLLEQALNEEAANGWVMLEKFDDYRIRFKRLRKDHSNHLEWRGNIDPYRTYFGQSLKDYNTRVITMVLGVTGLVFIIMIAVIWLATVAAW
ncbi:MAG TPA: hypothetical protein PKH77_15055 [Anaerolineae bacterium]|nr:hypothetical protein [Anaerolineae bacterium]